MEIIFIHHSVGRNIINTGLKNNLKKYGFLLTDIDYNKIGIHDESNKKIIGPIIPNDKTNPEDLLKILNNNQTLNYLNSFDLVILKSCYTIFNIKNNKQFLERLSAIKELGNIASKVLNKVIIVTPPPLSRFRYFFTNKEYYRKIIEQYKNIKEQSNLKVFDLHMYLSIDNKWLSKKYQRLFLFDSHPNKSGSIAVVNKLLDFIKSIK
jgi:hypothetical protein